MKKLLLLLSLIPTLLFGQQNLGQVTTIGNTTTKIMKYNANHGVQFDARTVVDKGYVDSVKTTIPAWLTTGNSGTTAGTNFLGTTDGQDVVFKRNSAEIMRINATGLGIGSTNPLAKLHVVTTTSTTATSFPMIATNSAGQHLLCGDAAGHYGIGIDGGTGTSNGTINDCYLEVVALSNADGQYTFAVKDSARAFTMFRISNHHTAGAPDIEMGSDIWMNGYTGMGVRANTSYRTYIKGIGATSGTYGLVMTNGSSANIFQVDDAGSVNYFNYFNSNPFASNASTSSIVGGANFNSATQTLSAAAQGSAPFRLTCTSAMAQNNGVPIIWQGVYNSGSGAKIGFAGIVGIKENGTDANSAGALLFGVWKNADDMYEYLRITSTGGIAFNGSSNYGSTGQILTSNGNAPPTWNTEGQLLHAISTPTVGATVTLTDNYINIISPAGTLASLTINFPNSPSNNDFVEVTFDQIITTVTYVAGTGGATIKGQINGVVGGQKRWDYDNGTNTWY